MPPVAATKTKRSIPRRIRPALRRGLFVLALAAGGGAASGLAPGQVTGFGAAGAQTFAQIAPLARQLPRQILHLHAAQVTGGQATGGLSALYLFSLAQRAGRGGIATVLTVESWLAALFAQLQSRRTLAPAGGPEDALFDSALADLGLVRITAAATGTPPRKTGHGTDPGGRNRIPVFLATGPGISGDRPAGSPTADGPAAPDSLVPLAPVPLPPALPLTAAALALLVLFRRRPA